MYEAIHLRQRELHPAFPKTRRPLVGSVIKEIRIDKGIRQDDFAQQSGINLSTLKSIENDHQKATTVDNLEKFAKLLDVSPESLILHGREWDPANYFAQKKQRPPKISGIRKWKRAPDAWNQTTSFQFKEASITVISPPINTPRDFFFFKIEIPPSHRIGPFSLGASEQVIGYAASGFSMSVEYESKSFTLTANQAFLLDGQIPHYLINGDDEHTAVLYLMTKIPAADNFAKRVRLRHNSSSFSIARGIHKLRENYSPLNNRPIPIQHLADRSESLDREQIRQMMRQKKGSSVVYWEKIEHLLSAFNVSMSVFLGWAKDEKCAVFSLATSQTRARVEFPAYGAKLYSALPPGAGNNFYCGQLAIEGMGTVKREGWKRQDNAMIALFIEEGEIEVIVGKRRSPMPLSKGECIYFDGSLGYLLRNPGRHQCRAFLASYPGIQL